VIIFRFGASVGVCGRFSRAKPVISQGWAINVDFASLADRDWRLSAP